MQYTLIYLHGFLSSPQSEKAQLTRAYVEQYHPDLTLEIPEIPNYPAQAVASVEAVINQYKGTALRFIGSSMGGYLSTYCVEKYGGKAALINPAVKPFELLLDYLGDHVNPYTNVPFTLDHSHIDDLLTINTANLSSPDAYWALLQTADETLDYRQAEAKYANGRLTIESGGDHSFVGYERHLPEIFRFLLQP